MDSAVYARLSPICGLCQVAFKEGEEFKAIYSEDIGFRDVADKINAYYSKA